MSTSDSDICVVNKLMVLAFWTMRNCWKCFIPYWILMWSKWTQLKRNVLFLKKACTPSFLHPLGLWYPVFSKSKEKRREMSLSPRTEMTQFLSRKNILRSKKFRAPQNTTIQLLRSEEIFHHTSSEEKWEIGFNCLWLIAEYVPQWRIYVLEVDSEVKKLGQSRE